MNTEQPTLVKIQTYKVQWRTFGPAIWNDIPGEEWGDPVSAELRLGYWQKLGLPVVFRVQST